MITVDLVARVPLFSQLTQEQQELIADRAADMQLQPGDWLIQEGELPSFFVLLAGSLDIVKMRGDVEHLINCNGPGSFFGELPLLLGSTAVISLRASEPSRILRLDPADFHDLILGTPALSVELLKEMAGRIENLQQFTIENAAVRIQIIGYRWDPQCYEMRDFLTRNRVVFTWLKPTDAAAQAVLHSFGVENPCPLVVLQDGSTLVNPSRRELAERLGLQTVPTKTHYDVAILGAGPTGLAAAVYGASEGLSTVLIEREAPGGQAGTSSRIENYLGFPSGLSGEDLSRRAWQQARRFGAELLVTRSVKAIDLECTPRAIILDGDERLYARSIVIATGVSWRHPSIPGLDALFGRGVCYGAAQTEARGVHGKDVYMIGAGNSAGQAALFFSNYARSVTLLVRGDTLGASMSQYLIDQLATKANIVIRRQCEVVEVQGREHLEAIVVRDRQTQSEQTLPTDELFILIGANAQTEWLPKTILRDEGGYLLTGRDVVADQTAAGPGSLPHAPYFLETSIPGVFAAGDVRHGSIKRVASGVGEGSMSIAFVHQYLTHEA